MDTENAAAGGELEPAPVVGLPNLFEAGAEDYSAADAAREYDGKTAEAAEAPAEKSEAKAEDAAPETALSEEPQDEPETPTIDPPSSWTKEAKERWSALPPETQSYLAEREQQRDKEIRRIQNEAADQRKAIETERKAAEEARKQYEAKIPALSKALESVMQNEFADIKSFDDLRKMQAEDPFRYQQWDLRQKEIALIKQEEQAATERQLREKQSEWAKYVHEESKAFAEEVPQFKEKEAEYTKKAADTLRDLGFTEDQLNKLANGEEKISLFDRRLQRLLFDRITLSEIKAAPAKAIPKPVPAVQKPGVAAPRGTASAESVQASRNKLASSGSVEDAFALYMAKQRRRSA